MFFKAEMRIKSNTEEFKSSRRRKEGACKIWLFKKGENLGLFEDRGKVASAKGKVSKFRENWR